MFNKAKLKVELAKNTDLVAKFEKSEYFQRFMKEAKLQGNISDETPSVDTTLEILANVIMGMESYLTTDFAVKHTTDSDTFKLPIAEYDDAIGAISSGDMPENQVDVDYVDVTLNAEFGGKAHWTRAYIRSATFDGMALQQKGMGVSLQKYIVGLLVAAVVGISEANLAGGEYIDLGTDITWDSFVDIVTAVDADGYGPADFVLVSPWTYGQLLKLDQFINSLYSNTAEAIKSGIVKTSLGCTVVKVEGVTDGWMVALNSAKAIALITRAAPKVEPFEHPETNEYGFVLSMVASVTLIFEKAVAIGKLTSLSP